MNIIAKTYDWAHPLVHRTGDPPHLVWHHAAVKVLSPDAVHKYDVEVNGWSGMGYHFYVRKDGSVYRGRPLWAMGAHARGYNDSIGICAEGAYHTEKVMPAVQLKSLQELHDHLHAKYPEVTDKKHSDLNATACPGAHYPYAQVVAGVPKPVEPGEAVPHHGPLGKGRRGRVRRLLKKLLRLL